MMGATRARHGGKSSWSPPSQPAPTKRGEVILVATELLFVLSLIVGVVLAGRWLWYSIQPKPGPLPNLVGMRVDKALDELVEWRRGRNLDAYNYEVTDYSRMDRGGVEDERSWVVVATSPKPGEMITEGTEVVLRTLSAREMRFYTQHARMPRIRAGLRPGAPLRTGALRDLNRPGGWPVSLVDYRAVGGGPVGLGEAFRTTGRTFPLAGKRLQVGQPIVVQFRERRPPPKVTPPPPSGGADEEASEPPPGGWTNDALTPGYTGCRQGYPGGRINGVYWWRPIPC